MPDTAYEWRNNLACVATYKTLEKFLNEFDDVAFEDAASLKMRRFRYYPRSTTNANIIRALATETARRFLRHLLDNYVVTDQVSTTPSATFIRKIAAVFRDGDKTIVNLAEVVDGLFRFEDEE